MSQGDRTTKVDADIPATEADANALPGGPGGGIGGTLGQMLLQLITGAAPPKTAKITRTDPGWRACCALGFSAAVAPGAVAGDQYVPVIGLHTDPVGYPYTAQPASSTSATSGTTPT